MSSKTSAYFLRFGAWSFFLFVLCSFDPITKAWFSVLRTTNDESKYKLETEYIYRFATERPAKGEDPYLLWNKFGPAFNVGILVESGRQQDVLYQNIAYVLKYHKTIQGKRIETQQITEGDLNNLEAKKMQLVIIGNGYSFPGPSPENTVLVSIAEEILKIPNDPTTYDSIPGEEKAFSKNKDRLIVAESLLNEQSMAGSHIRFFNMQLEAPPGKVSPTYLVFRIDAQKLKQSGFLETDALAELQQKVLQIAQNKLLLSNDQFVDVTLITLHLLLPYHQSL